MGSLDGRVAIITGAGGASGGSTPCCSRPRGQGRGQRPRCGGGGDGRRDPRRRRRGDRRRTTTSPDWDGGEALDRGGRRRLRAASTCWSTTPASSATGCWSTCPRRSGTRSSTVHLKGHFVPTRFAAAHWREQVKAGREVEASVIHTSSTSGLLGNPGQTNYGAAKAGIGVVQHHLRPGARPLRRALELHRTRRPHPPHRGHARARRDGGGARPRASTSGTRPTSSPLVAYLATADCDVTGRTFFVQGGTVRVMEPWRLGERLERDDRWTIEDLGRGAPALVSADVPTAGLVARRGAREASCTIWPQSCPARWGGVLDVAFPSRRDEAAAPAGGHARPRACDV